MATAVHSDFAIAARAESFLRDTRHDRSASEGLTLHRSLSYTRVLGGAHTTARPPRLLRGAGGCAIIAC